MPSGLADQPLTLLYGHLSDVIGEALGLGGEATDDAIQTFEVLRMSSEVIAGEHFNDLVEEYALKDSQYRAAEQLDVAAQQSAWVARDKVTGKVADSCFAYSTHVFAAERTYEASGPHRWRSPVAERIADEVARLGNEHPVTASWKIDSAALWLALQGVSAAVGRVAKRLERGYSGVIPDEFWLDTGKPPA